MKRALLIAALATGAVVANAQSRSSFHVPSSLTGITITSSDKLHYNVSLANNASMFYQGQTYKINDVFGFWLLDNNNDMKTAGNNSGVWQYHENYVGQGGIGGLKTNPNTGIQSGGNRNFTFTKVDGMNEAYGVHLRLDKCASTLYVELPCQAVPEPATMAVLGMGVVAIIRRRKQSK